MPLTVLLPVAYSGSFLYYAAQAHLPGGSTARSGLGPPTQIASGENVPTEEPTGQSDRGSSSLSASLPRHSLGLCQADQK